MARSTETGFEIAVFSYNRGAHLLNCVNSIQRHIPQAAIVVIDDGSTDCATLDVLASIERDGATTVRRTAQSAARGYNGGLHRNISRYILDEARADISILLQDDMQVVRDLDDSDEQTIRGTFTDWPSAAFLLPVFLTHNSYEDDIDPASVGDPNTIAFRKSYEYAGYFDVCIAHVARLRTHGFVFGDERESATRAVATFGPMRIMRRPFVGHLPLTPCFRYRQRTWIQRVCELRRVGLYPLAPLSPAALESLSTSQALPTAERYLTCPTLARAHPWPNTWHEDVPRMFSVLERLELRVRRRLRRHETAPNAAGQR